jgi:RNA polymerase sigma factor (sigma-70 family)
VVELLLRQRRVEVVGDPNLPRERAEPMVLGRTAAPGHSGEAHDGRACARDDDILPRLDVAQELRQAGLGLKLHADALEGSGGAELAWVLEWIKDKDLHVFIERLPLPQRQVLAMRFVFDMRTKEIAEILGRTPNDVSKLQYRALEFLNERLTAIGREPPNTRRLSARHRPKQAEVLRERRFSLWKK